MRLPRAASAVLWIACGLAALAPVFAAEMLPLLDAPNHLGAIAIWHHHGDPAFGFAQHYDLNLRPVPYWGYYAFVHLLGHVIPLVWANKVFIALAILALPSGMAALLRAHGRPTIYALAGFPLAWSYDMALGFIAYVAGLGVLLWAYALLARFAQPAFLPSRRLLVANLAAGFILYFLHPLPFLLWIPGVIVYTRLAAPLFIAGPLALFAAQLAAAREMGLRTHPEPFGLDGRWRTFVDNLGGFTNHVFDFVPYGWRWFMLGLLFATVAAAGVLVRRDRTHRDRRPLLLLGAAVLGYFVLPEHIYKPINWWMINGRLAVPIAVLAFVALPAGVLAGWRRAVVAAPLVAMAVAYPIAIAQRFRDFDGRAADFRAVVEALPMNPSVLVVVYPPLRDPAVSVECWRQFASYVQVERGGWNPWSWKDGFPMKTRPEARRPAPSNQRPHEFDWDLHAAHYDYLVMRDLPDDVLAERPVTRLAEQGRWTVWRIDHLLPQPVSR